MNRVIDGLLKLHSVAFAQSMSRLTRFLLGDLSTEWPTEWDLESDRGTYKDGWGWNNGGSGLGSDIYWFYRTSDEETSTIWSVEFDWSKFMIGYYETQLPWGSVDSYWSIGFVSLIKTVSNNNEDYED